MLQYNTGELIQLIREDIKSKGYSPDIPGFQDVSELYGLMHPYNYDELVGIVYQMNLGYHVKLFRELPGGPVVVFIKKIIRWFMVFLMAPVLDEQNTFNGNVTSSVEQLLGYIDEQNYLIKNMEKRIEQLEEKVTRLSGKG